MTSKICKLIIKDQTNATFVGLDPLTRRKCNKELKFFIHAARHMPAFKLGRWDGCVSFFAINGNTYVNLLDKVLPIISSAGYDVELEDKRPGYQFEFPVVTENYFDENFDGLVWPVGHQAAGKPIILRDYQIAVIQAAIENPQSVQSVATGAGKTLVCATLSHLCEDYGRTIIIVPNRDLVKQTEADYRNIGLDVGVYFGDRKEIGHTHMICTWQSLDRIAKNDKAGTSTISMAEFIKDVVCVIVDEAHAASAQVLQSLLCGPLSEIPIRWGLTGTIPKEEHNFTSILASVGPVVNELPARELIDLGVLAECHVNIIQMQDTAEYPSYPEEYNYLVTDENRLDWIAKLITERALDGNTLVLVGRIETGKELNARISGSSFVSGSTKSDSRKESYDDMATENNKIIIATFGVAAVGINIPRIFNLVLIEAGKSFVRVIQSIGRSIRIAKDKKSVDIWDVASTCRFSAKHVSARKKFYRAAKYPYSLKKVDYMTQLSTSKITLEGK